MRRGSIEHKSADTSGDFFFFSPSRAIEERERLLELVQKIGDKACGVGARRVWVVGAVAAAVAAESPQGTKGGWT